MLVFRGCRYFCFHSASEWFIQLHYSWVDHLMVEKTSNPFLPKNGLGCILKFDPIELRLFKNAVFFFEVREIVWEKTSKFSGQRGGTSNNHANKLMANVFSLPGSFQEKKVWGPKPKTRHGMTRCSCVFFRHGKGRFSQFKVSNRKIFSSAFLKSVLINVHQFFWTCFIFSIWRSWQRLNPGFMNESFAVLSIGPAESGGFEWLRVFWLELYYKWKSKTTLPAGNKYRRNFSLVKVGWFWKGGWCHLESGRRSFLEKTILEFCWKVELIPFSPKGNCTKWNCTILHPLKV